MMKSPVVSVFAIAFAGISLHAQVHLGPVPVGTREATAVTVTIANAGTLASLAVVTGGAGDMDFTDARGGTCKIGNTYQAGSTCTVRVAFSPKLTGPRLGGISLADENGNSLATVYLTGNGLGPQAAFAPATQVSVLANLNNVADLSVDASNNVYVAESQTYPEDPGAPEIPGGLFKATNMGGDTYTLNNIGENLIDPVGVAVDGDGNVLEADDVLGPAISPDQGTAAPLPGHFYEQQSLAVDAQGNIYSAGYGAVYKSSPAFATTQTYAAVVTGLGTIRSLAVDAQGDIYVPDSGSNPAVYKETPTKSGTYIQTQIGSGWVQPTGVAVDAKNVVYVNDSGTVYAVTQQPDGSYATTPLLVGQNNGAAPSGLAVDGDGSLYVPVSGGTGPFGPTFDVDKFDRSAPPALSFATTSAGSTSADSPRIVTISNLGNEPLRFSKIHYPNAFPESKGGKGHCSAATNLAPGASCIVSIDFAPVHDPRDGSSSETLNDRIEITTDTLNAPQTKQAIQVTGTKTRRPTAEAPLLAQPSGTYSSGMNLSLSDATPGSVIYYTLDGKTPTETTGIRYTGPEPLKASATIKAVAYASGYAPSGVVAATYKLTVAKPVISPAGGAYKGPVTVSIVGATPGATIFYTTEGNLPTTSSKHYTGPFRIDSSQRVIAIAAKTGADTSAPVEQAYKLAPAKN